jgi:DNA processing protein
MLAFVSFYVLSGFIISVIPFFIKTLNFLHRFFIADPYTVFMEEMEKNHAEKDIRLMLPNDADWPALLREIPDPPERLFVRGSWPPRSADGTAVNKETKFLCIVGARRHTTYGREACQALISGLEGYNICIVSGLALGIDGIAHEAALAVGLPTIAFPGSGLKQEVLYPPRNVRLAKRIMDTGGALLSEFDLDMEATPWCFQQRNRLMAGISHATLVIEAKRPSGTLITSKYANEYNRDVFALPGDIFSPLSDGPHMLIQRGAAIIRNSEDILYELGIKIRPDGKPERAAQNSLFDNTVGGSEDEKMIYKIILDAGGKINIDDLIRIFPKASATVALLEINGRIREKNGVIHIAHGHV